MAEFFGLEDLAMERTLLQQLRTELNSSANKRFFLFEGGSKLSFAALTISLLAICTQIRIVVGDINNLNNFRQFLPWLKPWASLAWECEK
ncbi:MAG: hypothetical protein DRN88_04120 [Candidatus Hydrothermarchaeota archaeon]|nr:MAG: hypothetical protein DRN88_04120 [Candidatus Hydrothermarchaeota archaeon]